jgi:hypothetical protein
MNIETTLAIYAYGTSEGVTKAWDTRGRHPEHGSFVKTDKKFPDTYVSPKGDKVEHRKSEGYSMQRVASGASVTFTPKVGKPFEKTWKGDNAPDASSKYAFKKFGVGGRLAQHRWGGSKMSAGCHGANCGRKGRKAGAKPLRSYLTKQESDTLNSKALKVKSRKKARKKY